VGQGQIMTEADIIIFQESFERCMVASRFLDTFYDHFLKSSPEVAAKFQGTDFTRQKRMLKVSLYAMVGALVLHSADYSILESTARRHARTDREIPPHLYALWLDSLIFAAKICDPIFDAKAEQNWREAMQSGIDYIVSFY
jgi:hemoglobin-like flavoprotein